MNKRAKSILLNLTRNNNYLDNKEIYAILDKFKDNNQFVEQNIVDEFNKYCAIHVGRYKQIEEYNKSNNYNNVFHSKGIYTINDLYKFMNDNFEYGGVLIIDNERIKLPFGPVYGAANYNSIVRYEDEYVFKHITNLYNNIEPNNELTKYISKQFYNKDVDICSLEQYQKIINDVGTYVQKKMWRQRTVFEILNDQISNCYESSYLVGEFLKYNNVKYQKYIIGRYDNLFLAHMFITYELNNKYYYFENALTDFRGIYEYDSKTEMEQDIFTKFIYNNQSKIETEVNFDNYFLKPIDDLEPTGSFENYFKYFNTIPSVRLNKLNYNILINLTNSVLQQVLSVATVYNNDSNIFCNPINFPKKEEFYDIELWNRKVYKILRKNIINISFYPTDRISSIYMLNSLGGFYKYNNIIDVGANNTRSQLVYNKEKVYNIFTIEDLEKALASSDLIKVKEILTISSLLENKKDIYDYGCVFTTNLSKYCVSLVNNNNDDEKICNYKNIDLSGRVNNKNIALSNTNFLKQIFSIAKALEIMSESISFLTKKDYQNDFINSFVDYFCYMIDVNSIEIDKINNDYSNEDSKFIDKLITKLLNSILNKKNKQ